MFKVKEHPLSLEDQPELTERQLLGLCRQQPLLQLLRFFTERIRKSSSLLHRVADDTKL